MKKLLALFTVILATTSLYGQHAATGFAIGGPANDVAKDYTFLADSTVALIGSTSSFGNGGSDVYFVKLNKQLDSIIETNVIGESGIDIGNAIEYSSVDGGFIVAGMTNSFGSGGYDAYLLKLLPDGNIDWDMTFGTEEWDIFNDVLITPNFDFIAVGRSLNPSKGYEGFVVKTDFFGNEVWRKTFGAEFDDEFLNITSSVNNPNEFILSGYQGVSDSSRAGWILKINEAGDSLKSFLKKDSRSFEYHSTIANLDSGYCTVGISFEDNTKDINEYIFTLDSSFNWIKETQLFGADPDYFHDVLQKKDSNYVTVGKTLSFGNGDQAEKYGFRFIEITKDLQLLYGPTLGYTENDKGHKIGQLSNGQIFGIGSSDDFEHNLFEEMFVIKLDSNEVFSDYSLSYLNTQDTTLPAPTGISELKTTTTSNISINWVSTEKGIELSSESNIQHVQVFSIAGKLLYNSESNLESKTIQINSRAVEGMVIIRAKFKEHENPYRELIYVGR